MRPENRSDSDEANSGNKKSHGRAAFGVLIGWAGSLLGLVIAFFVTPILVRGLGNELYGIWSFLQALTSYYALVDLGLGKAVTKYLAEYNATEDREQFRRIFSTAFRTYVHLATLVIILGLLLTAIGPYLFNIGDVSPASVRLVLFLLAIRIGIQLVFSPFRSALLGDGQFHIASSLLALSQVLIAASAVWVVRSGGGIVQLAGYSVAISLLVSFVNLAITQQLLKLPWPAIRDSDPKTRKQLFRFGAVSLLANSSRKIGARAGTLVAGILAGPASVAFYDIANMMSEKATVFGRPVGQICMPTASRLRAVNDTQEFGRLVVISSRLLLGIGFAFAITFWTLGRPFLNFWMTEEFSTKAFPLLQVLAAAIPLKMLRGNLGNLLQGVGQLRVLGIVSAAEGILVIVLGTILTFMFGILGMAWAVFIAVALPNIPLGAEVINTFKLPAATVVWRAIWPVACVTAVFVAVSISIKNYWTPPGLYSTAFGMAAMMLVFVALTLCICLDAQARTSIRGRLMRRNHSSPA